MKLTVGCAVAFAFCRIIGFRGVLNLLIVGYIFAPVIAMSLSLLGTTESARQQIGWSFIGAAFIAGEATFIAWEGSSVAFPTAMGCFCAWLPQACCISLIYKVWQSGLKAAGCDWPLEKVTFDVSPADPESIANAIYDTTCRTGFQSPGFCVINLGKDLDSQGFRKLMIDTKEALSQQHVLRTGKSLVFVTASRFDQQESTRPHLDSGPAESMLLLGYEPSEIESEIEIIDFACCAFRRGMSPADFLAAHNPMFSGDHKMLQPYATKITNFSASDFQIVCINNSSAEYSFSNPTWQGVLHTATIPNPDESKRRVINSTMIAPEIAGDAELQRDAKLKRLLLSDVVHRHGYDKLHLHDA